MTRTVPRVPSHEDPVIRSARLVIRPLGLDDAPRLQAVFEATPDHFAVVAGQAATPESAAHELRESAARPGREVALISLADGTDAGALGWWAAHPEPDVALLGMILVAPAHRGAGVAREALSALEARLAAQGIRRLRTAFQRRRLAIHPVVKALGFAEMSIREHTRLGLAGASISLWEKAIENGNYLPHAETQR
ncbi:MAG TPA: GNAT family N-acetyltransferase [Longimicrobium sp.]|nr:GNAT family N-acetyltransferase [Longimicrobium sp.]